MSDVSGIEIKDVLGLSGPLTKLIETISNGVGKLYEPTHIKRLAKAKASEVHLLSESILEADLLPIKYDEGAILIDGTDFTEMAKRAESRLAFQELKKQNNIDCVVGYAAQSLSSVEQVSDDPVDVDWITRFFDSVADVSSQEMQVIWGRILAGEVNQPGSFSLRTLEIVKNLSKSDAELFTKVATLVVTSESEKLICSDSEILNKYGISYTNLMLLDECGLINSSGTLSYNPIVTKEHKYFFYSTERIAFFTDLSDDEIKMSFGVHTLTSAGRELLSIVESKPSNDYFLDYVKKIESNYKGKIKAAVHIVNEIIDKNINYKIEPLHNINSTAE